VFDIDKVIKYTLNCVKYPQKHISSPAPV